MSAVDAGRRVLVLRAAGASLRIPVRAALVVLGLLLVSAAVLVLSLATGTYEIPVPEVIASLLGRGDGSADLVVREWRLPRALLALLFGAALGMSGAIFQSITRNPLGSPDIIGFSSGSFTGALIVILVTGGGYLAIGAGALLGGTATAAVVFLLAYRRGVQGFRLIIVGIGVSAMLGSVNTVLLLRATEVEVMSAGVWGSGSLNGLGGDTLLPVLIALAALSIGAALLARPLRALELGDDAAGSQGVRPVAVRLAAMLLGVALIALVTASAGPIAFVALVAPQIARRLTRSAHVGLTASAALGAALLGAADLLGQRVFAPLQLPVGIVTVSIGGVYFLWLLVREGRRR